MTGRQAEAGEDVDVDWVASSVEFEYSSTCWALLVKRDLSSQLLGDGTTSKSTKG